MELNIHDKTLKYIGVIDNNLPDALHYFNDTWHRYLTEGSSTFEFSVPKNHPDFSLIQESSYISFYYGNQDYLFNIIGMKEDDKSSLTISCINLNLGLIYEQLESFSNNKRHSIIWYLKNAAKIIDNLLEIGRNPFSEVDEDKNNPILTFDSSESKLTRILSICKSFNAEFQFRTKLKNDGALESVVLDLYLKNGVGQVRKDITLYYGKNIIGITRTMDKTAIFNATTVTDSNKKYNWLAVEGKVYNDEGKLEFYKDAGENTAYALISRDTFPAQLKSDRSDLWIRKDLSVSATSNDSLWDYAVSQFKQFAYPQMTYEVVVASNAVTDALGNNKLLDIGDTVTIQDGSFDQANGGLILSARVSEQEISFTNPANNKLTFTNFVQLKSDISPDLYSRMKAMVDQNTPYRSEPSTTNGTSFKNGQGSTTLTAHIYKGAEDGETKADSYEWFKDDVSVANAQTITVDASGINEKAVYRCQATIDGKVVGTSEITLTNVNDGTPGKKGDDGRSIVKMEQKYRVTTTNATPTEAWDDSSWSETQVATTSANKYAWSITHVTYSSGTPLVQDLVQPNGVYGDKGDKGDKGDGGDTGAPGKIVSDTEPTTKFKGLTWKYSGTADMTASDGTAILAGTEYYWDGTKWEVSIMNIHNLNVDKLTTLTPDLGDATAGSLTLLKGDTGGAAIKDGVVKTWDVSEMSDPNYPNGYSYTSMGAALDSGGITFYSADYGHKVDKAGVIDDQYKVATLRAIAHNDRKDVGVGLVLETTISDFPLNIIGNFSVNNQLLYDIIYPIGCLYTSYVNQNPHDLYGIGTWTRINGRVIVGVSESESEFSSAGKTGGEKTHVLSANEMPSHGHTDSVDIKNANAEAKGYGLTATSGFKDRVIINNSGKATHTGAAGGGAAHNNLQPYMALYMWRRTA